MSDSPSHTHGSPRRPPRSDEELGALLRAAGPRPEVPAEELEMLKGVARRELERRHAGREEAGSSRSPAARLALAAGLLLALVAGWWLLRPAPPPVIVASVELVRGTVDRDGEGASPEVGVELPVGVGITTEDDSLLSLRLAGGESLRLDSGSRIRLVGARRVELETGAVYLDSAGQARRAGLEVATPLGVVRDIGTQFEVRLAGGEGGLQVRVREGEVSLARGDESHRARRGEQLVVDRDGGVERGVVAPDGEAWRWALEAAPTPDIEGMPLADFVRWVGRETGWEVRYESTAAEEAAASISLHGSIEGLTPGEAVEVVLPGSGLGYRVHDGTLVVGSPVAE